MEEESNTLRRELQEKGEKGKGPSLKEFLKAKKQERQLRGQFDEWDGEMAGAPPSLAQAVDGITHELKPPFIRVSRHSI